MKHLAMIQTEFLKTARKWDDLSYDEQKAYLQNHPKTKRRLTVKPGQQKSQKMSFKDVMPNVLNIDGWEIRKNSEGKYEMGRGYSSEVKQNARNYIKGLKKLFAESKKKGSFEAMGEAYHGNTNTQESKFNKITSIPTKDIIAIGQGKNHLVLLHMLMVLMV